MLKKLEKQDFDRYVEFAYRLASDMTKSGYPTYADGIKTKDDFVSRAREAFLNDNEEILLFERDGKVSGWIHYFHIPEDKYLDTCAFCITEGTDEALAEFTAYARGKFSGYELYLGFPKDNIEAVAALDRSGFERIEESYNNVLDFEHYIPLPESKNVIPITRDNFKLFSVIHSQQDDDMYWSSEKILADIDNWSIYVYILKEEVKGAIYLRKDNSMSEIFGVDFPNNIYDGDAYRALLTTALNDCKRNGTRHMVFFNEGESQPDAIACGFRRVGEYVCYKIEL
ncbi:MAG: hypothetical protein J1E39_03920 [Eubacterium sp.]|nr:hypothetical protein [Eubacterium sp.]